jgi:hypothetical protein
MRAGNSGLRRRIEQAMIATSLSATSTEGVAGLSRQVVRYALPGQQESKCIHTEGICQNLLKFTGNSTAIFLTKRNAGLPWRNAKHFDAPVFAHCVLYCTLLFERRANNRATYILRNASRQFWHRVPDCFCCKRCIDVSFSQVGERD